MNSLSLGRVRALQASATSEGIFTILAMDHRDALRALMDANKPDAVSAQQITDVKLAVVRALAQDASAVLLDPLYSAAQAIATHTLPGHVGLLCALENQGYLGNPFARETTLLENWSVAKAKRLGATGVKILLFYHPDAGAVTDAQDALVQRVLEDCAREDMPLFLEPISYSLDANIHKDSASFARERRRIVIESVKRLGALQPDVLKVEFPVDVKHAHDKAVWRDACAELNDASPVPWALLSADEPFDVFKEQVRIACAEGCSGFLVGRAVWRDAAFLQGKARDQFLGTRVRARFLELVDIARASGKAWYARYKMPMVDENWYRGYGEGK